MQFSLATYLQEVPPFFIPSNEFDIGRENGVTDSAVAVYKAKEGGTDEKFPCFVSNASWEWAGKQDVSCSEKKHLVLENELDFHLAEQGLNTNQEGIKG